ncbi:type IV pilus modification PilV family protein [Horticoccus sp. 23ND18S-11]|uniref:type IV pilus modification PilV family protein n=1 Tax=Horticoccus sp. 23ND18S-11 TaxID=3391832 RepID=UPI0039C94A8B
MHGFAFRTFSAVSLNAAGHPRRTDASRQRLRSQRGFTILEVAMASFVLAMGIATSIIAMQVGFRHLDLARGSTLASQILQSEMERIRLMSWSGVNALPASQTFDGGTFFSSNEHVVGKFSVTRTCVADSVRPTEVMNLNISVQWNTYDGRPHTRSFSSIYARNGLYDYYYTVAHP